MPKSIFVYVTYIRTTPEKLWSALTDVEIMKQYWFGVRCESQWTAGSSWKMSYPDGRNTDAGEILEALPPRRLVIRWQPLSLSKYSARRISASTDRWHSPRKLRQQGHHRAASPGMPFYRKPARHR